MKLVCSRQNQFAGLGSMCSMDVPVFLWMFAHPYRIRRILSALLQDRRQRRHAQLTCWTISSSGEPTSCHTPEQRRFLLPEGLNLGPEAAPKSCMGALLC